MGTVLITGASSGLGAELSRLFAGQGHDLILVSRRRERLERLKEEILKTSSCKVLVVEADLSRPEAASYIYQTVQRHGRTVDILINNAGFGVYGEFLHSDFSKILEMYQVNVLAALHLIRLFLPGMVARNRGQLVNIASMGAFFPGPLMAAYFAAKADILSLTRALAFELRGSAIVFTTVCPGPFKSGFQESAFGKARNTSHEHRLASSKQTAEKVFCAILERKRTVMPGLSNKIIYWFCHILPSSVVLHCVYRAQLRLKT